MEAGQGSKLTKMWLQEAIDGLHKDNMTNRELPVIRLDRDPVAFNLVLDYLKKAQQAGGAV